MQNALTEGGIFFLITCFAEGWSLPDCKYHLSRMRGMRLRRNKISFGGRLTWDLREMRHLSHPAVTIHTGKKGSITNRREQAM